MSNLREQLEQILQGRVCLMGLGNAEYGDDGFGVRLAEELKTEVRSPKSEGRMEAPSGDDSDFGLRSRIIIAGTMPERILSRVVAEGFDHIVFLDAVEFGGAPGSVILLNSEEMAARFPQISTHKLSLSLLAKQIAANGRTKAWLLGVQPESLKPGGELTPTVQATLGLLLALLRAGLESQPGEVAQDCICLSRGLKSGRGQPHSKTLRRSPTTQKSRSVLACDCPLPLSPADASVSLKQQTREGERPLVKGFGQQAHKEPPASPADLSLVTSAATMTTEVLA